MSHHANEPHDVSRSDPQAHSCIKPRRFSWRWLLLTVALVLAAVVATSEIWARRELRHTDELFRAFRDRSGIAFWIDAERLNPYTSCADSNVLKVAVIGDSFTRGRDCFYTDTFGIRLEALLNINPNAKPARVDIYAEAGTGTREQRRLLNRAIADGPPDLVILAYCLNDTEDWGKQDEFVQWRKLMEPHPAGPVLARLMRISALADLYCRHTNDRQALKGSQLLYRNLYSPSYSGRTRMEQAMEYFRDVCRTNNTKLLVVMLPMFEIGDARTFQFATDTVKQVTGELGIPFFNAWPAFDQISSIRTATRPRTDGHPNEIAHRILAEEIFMYLLANEMVARAYIPIHKNMPEPAFEAALTRYRSQPQTR